MQPIKTALLSFGMSGKVFHAPFLNIHPGFELAGAWERSEQKIAAQYPGVISYPSLDALLSDESVELVIVNTPTSTHFDYARQCLLAGKHIVVEKAFTTTVAEAVELKELSEKVGKKLAVYHNRRYDSDFRTVQQVITKGWLGALKEAEIHFDRYKPELSPKQHKELYSAGAGLLKDLGSHIIDSANCLFGFPTAVFADIRITRPGSVVDDWFNLFLFHPTMRVTLKGSLYVRESLPGFVVHGEKGSFLKGRTDIQETELQAGKTPGGADWGKEPEEEEGLLHTEMEGAIVRKHIPSLQGNYYDYYEAVYQAIRNNQPVPVSAQEGINVMRIIDAAIQSSAERRVIEL